MTALQALTEVERPYASSIKCGVLYYPVFSDLQRNLVDVNAVIERSLRKDLPLLLVEVGKEHLEFRRGAELFTEKIHSTGMPLEHIYYADGVHGFDSQMDNPETRRIVRRTLDYMQQHLS